MSTHALADYRRRAYGDAAQRLTPAAAAIFAALGGDALLEAKLRREDAAPLPPDQTARADAQTLAGFAQQLEHVMAEVYEEPFPDLRLASGEIIDIDTSVPEGAETFRYYMFSGTSVARFSSAYSNGTSPGTSITAAVVTGNVECMENHYEYTMRDARNAAHAGVPLERMHATHAKRAHEELANDTGLWGREDIGLPGFVTHPNITITAAPATGTGSSSAWEDKTIDQILIDIRVLIDTAGEVSYGMRETTDVALPRAAERLLTTLRMGAGDGTLTLMAFIRQTYPGVTWHRLDELAASRSRGNLATDSAIAWVRNRENLRLVVPMQFRQYPPQVKDLKVRVPCESSIGGVIAKEPMTIHRLDGIGAS